MRTDRTQAGFTLVELSVVLAIIGLMVGGVVAGQSIVRASRVNSVGADVARYQTAAKTFKSRFNALPGDMANATSMWGIADGTGANNACYIKDSTNSVATCNGNGSNTIDAWNETFRFWQHLVNAQLIDGAFTGTKGSANFDHDVGLNCPTTKINNVGVGVTYSAASLASATQFAEIPNNYFVVGAEVANAMLTGGVMSPPELQNIDIKMDDGAPGRGTIIAGPWATCTNAANNADLDTTYKLTSTAEVCWFYYVNAF